MLNVKVKAKREIADGICTFELIDAEGRALPRFTAGAHVDIYIPGPDGFVRQYSLCNSPAETHRYVIGVLKDPSSRGGSEAMHNLAEGTILSISAPRNHFPLFEGAQHSILFAGGIGITPLLSMAEQLFESGCSFELHYSARSRSKLGFVDRIEHSRFRSNVVFHLDSEPDTKLDVATVLARERNREPHVYVCGPGGFIEYVLGTAREANYPEPQIHREYFGAVAVANSEEDRPFDVQISSTGQVIRVGAAESAVTALARHGIEIPVSCEQGVCGTCLTKVRSGVPLHRDLFLTDDERGANDQFTPCCSRAETALLVLEI